MAEKIFIREKSIVVQQVSVLVNLRKEIWYCKVIFESIKEEKYIVSQMIAYRAL